MGDEHPCIIDLSTFANSQFLVLLMEYFHKYLDS